MIVPLNIPPGLHRNGTEYQSRNRYRDSQLVRWSTPESPEPMGGWSGIALQNESSAIRTEVGRGMLAWTEGSAGEWLALGTEDGAYVIDTSYPLTYEIYQISSIAVGGEDQSSTSEVAMWVFDTFGEELIAWHSINRTIYDWDLNTANDLVAVTNAPTNCQGGFVVTPERFLMALDPANEVRRVEWSDRGDRTVWTPAATNQAGGFNLEGSGGIKLGLALRSGTLIITSSDAWLATYIGYPDVYEFQKIGACTAPSRRAGVAVGDMAYWAGENAFYVYNNGYVSVLPCDIGDWFFNQDLDVSQNTKVQAWHYPVCNEVWWMYQSNSSADDIDSYIVYNYALDVWYAGRCPFNSAVYAPDRTNSFSVATGTVFAFHTPEARTVVNGGFDTDSDWTKGTNWQIAAGVANQTSPTASNLESAAAITGFTSGGYYTIQLTVSNRTAGSLTVGLRTAPGGGTSALSAPPDGNGTVTTTVKAPDTSLYVFITADGTFDGDIDDVLIYATPLNEWDNNLVSTSSNLTWGSYTPYLETGPLEIGVGERRVHVTRLYPDSQDLAELDYTFKTREYPTASETSHGPYTAANPTDVRFSGRQFKMRVDSSSTTVADFRVGTPRLEIAQGGKR